MVGRLGSKTEVLSLACAGGDVALQVFLGRRFASTGCRNPELRHMFCGWIELVAANRKSNTLRDSISDARHAIMSCHRNDKDEECAAQRLSTIEKVQIETAPRIETAPLSTIDYGRSDRSERTHLSTHQIAQGNAMTICDGTRRQMPTRLCKQSLPPISAIIGHTESS